MQKQFAFIIGLMLLAGCATETIWSRGDRSLEQFNRDAAECERDATLMTATNNAAFPSYSDNQPFNPWTGIGSAASTWQTGIDKQALFDRCLSALGYKPAPKAELRQHPIEASP